VSQVTGAMRIEAVDAANGPVAPLPPAHHRRIELQCAGLVELARHVIVNGPDATARVAAACILRDFDVAEFRARPLTGVPGAVPLGKVLGRLAALRRELEHAWERVRIKLVRLAAGQRQWILKSEVQRVVELSADYIACETNYLSPLAAESRGDVQGSSKERRRYGQGGLMID
jgi:hypothetical protein